MTQKSFLSYLPPIFRNIREFAAIGQVVDEFIRRAYSDIEAMCSGLFIESATGEWLARHEKCYEIIPRATESEDERRFRLLTLSAGELPYTVYNLKRKLDTLCGADNYTLVLDPASCTFSITLSLGSETSAELIGDMLRRIVPANLSLSITTE